MNLSRRAMLAAAPLGTLPLVRLAHGAPAHRLTILHMNDFHSRHEPVDSRALECSPAAPTCFGGVAHLATVLAAERRAAEADGRGVMLLDAGDQFQGSMFYTVHHGVAELAVMHALGTEAMAVGNHEFDDGPENLARFVRGARFPVLSANVDASDEPALAGLLHRSVLLERAGLVIGVVAATTQEALVSSSPGERIRITEPGPALAEAAASCRSQGAQLVVALSHLGIDVDRELAGSIPGVAVFIGGHSHTLLSNSEAGAALPHPTVRDGVAGRALIVQAACFGRYVGRLDLDLDAAGAVLAYGGDCRHVGLEVAEDPQVAAIVASFAAPLMEARSRPVGYSGTALPAERCRVEECALGDLVADAALHAVHGADVALLNAGGLRTGLPGGALTLGDVMRALPFGNTLATLHLRGADLRDAVAHGLAQAGHGAFPLVAGLQVLWDPSLPPEQRLLGLHLRAADGTLSPLDPERAYVVATNNFIRGGGDGYTMLRDRALSAYDGGPGFDTVVAAALARRTSPPRADDRLKAR